MRGGNVHDIPTVSIASDPSKGIIEILLAHGWDWLAGIGYAAAH